MQGPGRFVGFGADLPGWKEELAIEAIDRSSRMIEQWLETSKAAQAVGRERDQDIQER